MIIVTGEGKMIRYKGKVIFFASPDMVRYFITNFQSYALNAAISFMDMNVLHEVLTTSYNIEPKPDFLKDEDIVVFESIVQQ